MHLEVLDEDVTKNDVIGSSTFKMSCLCVNQGIDEWFEIQYKGKKAGSVHLKSVWTPASKPQGTVGQQMQNVAQATMVLGAFGARPQVQPMVPA